MNVRNCKMCGRIFNYIAGQPVCPACKEKLEEKFQEVKNYIREKKTCSVAEVARECEVEEGQIRQWVREERLEFSNGEGVGITCENCGAAITTGRFCDKCKADMVNTFSAAGARNIAPQQQKKETRDNPRMRFLDNR